MAAVAPSFGELLFKRYPETTSGAKAFFKTGCYAIDVAQSCGRDTALFQRVREAWGAAKRAFCFPEIPSKLHAVYCDLSDFAAQPSWVTAATMVSDLTDLGGSAMDAVQIAVPFEGWQLNFLEIAGSGALAVGMACSIFTATKEVIDLTQRIGAAREGQRNGLRAERERKLISLAQYVTLFAIACLGLAASAGGIAVAPWILLALSVAALAFSVGGYFHKEICVARQAPLLGARLG